MNRLCHLLGVLSLLLAGSLYRPLQAEPEKPEPPRARKVVYEPNRASCTPQAITGAYRNHLLPWADQPEPVLARLRVLQAEMTRTSLTRCLEQGLLNAEQVRQVETSLGLSPPAPTTTAQSEVRP
jgi:hypothetical protein